VLDVWNTKYFRNKHRFTVRVGFIIPMNDIRFNTPGMRAETKKIGYSIQQVVYPPERKVERAFKQTHRQIRYGFCQGLGIPKTIRD
jgi:hypothetical protein